MGLEQLAGGAVVGGIVAIVVAVLNARSNRETKVIDASVATAQLQNTVWKDLLDQKDKTIARQDAEIATLKAALGDPAHAIAERDAVIESLLARLGPALAEQKEDVRDDATE